MTFTPTAQQEAFFEAVASTRFNILLRARAGCGKTTTAEHGLGFVNPDHKVLFVAFAKSNASELEARVKGLSNVEGRTTHSFGRKVLADNLGAVELVKDRVFQLAGGYARSRTERYALVKAVSLAKGALTWDAEEIEGLCLDFGVEMGEWPRRFVDRTLEIMRRCLDLESGIDFDDMIWLPVVRADVLEMPLYDEVFVDEVQDLNKAQLALVMAACAPGGRIVAIGDDRQCHPAGTMIELTGGKRVPIEQVKVGDQVVSYHDCFRGLQRQGRAVEATGCRPYLGTLLELQAGTSSVTCTPNHKVPTRFVERKGYALYVMVVQGIPRIGVCQAFYKHAFGPSMRARQEGATALWVLDILDDPIQARVSETVLSLGYGILERCRLYEKGAFKERLLEALRPNTGRLRQLLQAFGRDYSYPLWTPDSGRHIGSYVYVTEACNLLPGNALRTFDGTQLGGGWEIAQVTHLTNYSGNVFSLKVAPAEGGHRLYVADRVLVHNSIYQFRGADSAAIPNVIKAMEPLILPLSVTFRCAKAIVAEAQKIVPDITALPDAPDGKVEPVTYKQMIEGVEYGDFVLSRTNAPLVKVALALLSTDCRVMILGREIGQGLVSLIWKLKAYSPDDLSIKARQWAAVESSKLLAKDPPAEGAAALAFDRAECIAAMTVGMKTVDQVIERIRGLFEDGGKTSASRLDLVTLSTTHQAKGRERDRVWVMKDTYMRPRRGAPIDVEELNLYYVSVTRAKTELYLVKGLP